jgi:hyperosmotically inducible protein
MNRSSAVGLLAITGLIACSHDSPPKTVQDSAADRAEPAAGDTTTPLVTTTPTIPTRLAPPTATAAPTPVAAPAPPAAPSPPLVPDEPQLTPASGVAAPRTGSASLAGSSSAQDKADSREDQESLREIRELLAATPALSSTARQVTIVVRNGRVWLRGQVSTSEERAAIERSARQAGGVIDVRNELVVME